MKQKHKSYTPSSSPLRNNFLISLCNPFLPIAIFFYLNIKIRCNVRILNVVVPMYLSLKNNNLKLIHYYSYGTYWVLKIIYSNNCGRR